jgi:hypothetical protein
MNIITQNLYLKSVIWLLLLVVSPSSILAASPVLQFTDVISGPNNGLGDGLGEGAIVTIWAQNISENQLDNVVVFRDSQSSEHEMAHIYYWKPANGILPSGPANLYYSHRFVEIAVSIPSSASQGPGQIFIRNNQDISNELPFTIRPGKIYHVKPDGSDSTSADASFSNPWLTVSNAINEMSEPGGTLYIHDVNSGSATNIYGIYWNKSSASSTLEAQFVFAAYPGTRPKAIGSSGVHNYNVEGMVVSKLDIYASNGTEGPNGQPINPFISGATRGILTDRNGRAVGNRITDREDGCASKSQGAINGNSLFENNVDNYKIFGNEVYEYGCEGSDKLHHTTYMSVRDGSGEIAEPWEFGWNYLHDNDAKNGIHNYDENAECGNINGRVSIHDNVIVNQAGSGISIGGNCGWSNSWSVFNNVVINAGRASSWDGIDINTSLGADTAAISFRDSGLPVNVELYFNTIITWNSDDLQNGSQSAIGMTGGADVINIQASNNLIISNRDKTFVGSDNQGKDKLDNFTGASNSWVFNSNLDLNVNLNSLSSGLNLFLTNVEELSVLGTLLESGTKAILPAWNNQTVGPQDISVVPSQVPTHDLLGRLRNQTQPDNGAIEFFVQPEPPINISIE